MSKPKKLSHDQLLALCQHPQLRLYKPMRGVACTMLQQEEDGSLMWFGQRSDGRWYPYGKPLPVPAF